MQEKTIIYGEILDQAEKQEIRNSFPSNFGQIQWHAEAEPLEKAEGQAVVYVDLDDPRFNADKFLVSLAKSGRDVRLIGKSANPSLETAMRVARLGVAEILTPDQVFSRLHDFLQSLEKKSVIKDDEKPPKYSADTLIGKSTQIAEIKKMVRLLSDIDYPSALILGETGTGKSYICKILHNTGLRSKHNLVEVNCSAIPDNLFESELFGHVKGAFTDAKSEKIGLFEHAQHGTLFLDELGSLSQSSQAKLLKIIEDKRLRKVGDVSEKPINVRVVAATNKDLATEIENGQFREDLYYRLNLIVIRIPPLRERKEDIEPLVEHYLNFYSTLYGMPDTAISESAIEAMFDHEWPGNVRELCNVLERAVLLCKGRTIEADDVKAAFKNDRISIKDRRQIVIDVPSQGITLSEIEQHVVVQVLNMCDWNKTEAAKFLAISRPRLRRILDNAPVEQNRRSR